ncbi:hypothetical protein SAMN05421684_7872 [Asanoa ishikariensis]|uniref:ApeA N-terminal domain-containing protein n=2 Tax=Asanoa ishikariensis TaxID=137265 RepID=A0A1H3UR47_9ACTN|nr:hypothetical protein SAMN05421684_7872 [Asanoa ishikariensis]
MDKVLAGAIGHFWHNDLAIRKTDQKMERGYVRLNEHDEVEIASLNEDPRRRLFDESIPFPRSITGITEHGGIMALAITGRGSTIGFGHVASVLRYRAGAIVVGVNPNELRTAGIKSLTLYYSGLGSWAGIERADEEFGQDSRGILKTYSIALDGAVDETVGLSGGTQLKVSSHWSVTGPSDRRILATPTAITVQANRPRPANELRERLHWVHALACLAYSGFIVADGGAVIPDLGREGESPTYWDRRFMRRPKGAPEPTDHDFPMFRLASIGGIGGLGRWVRICEQHPRAVRPVVDEYLQGFRSPSVRLLEVASGIEYWVNRHRRSAGWAKASGSKALVLSKHVGKSFDQWTGNSANWARKFWDAYNGLKHEPSFTMDPRETAILAASGSLLLGVSVLNRAARSKAPAREIFGTGHFNWQLRDAVRDLVA